MGINKPVIGRHLLQSVCVLEQNLFCKEAVDDHDSRRTTREHNYCFDWKILVGTPILLVLVSYTIMLYVYIVRYQSV